MMKHTAGVLIKKFNHNPVNLGSEKAKANFARHLVNRRPPNGSKIFKMNVSDSVFTRLPSTYDFYNEKRDEISDVTAIKIADKTNISSFNLSEYC